MDEELLQLPETMQPTERICLGLYELDQTFTSPLLGGQAVDGTTLLIRRTANSCSR